MRRLLPSPAEIAALPPDGGPEFNRLIHETSPYLRQHAANPVDWYPWGEAAFARARTEDKPLFLSAGYSSCHWCHVMEHESFEDASVAEILNRAFIAIKVDREERPDLDEIYLAATQLLTGQGGWPNSVWLTPDGRPWFAGTYFPREDRYGRAGFRTVLLRVAELWQVRRAEVEAQADELSRAVREALAAGATGAARGGAGRALVDEALAALRQAYDPRHGGFGGAPKFPPHTALALLLHEHRRTGARDALDMATGTLDAMAAGGFRDHLGGGFHRYSTDAAWFLPHFEKMLYDNAQLARNYAEAWAVTGRAAYHDAARDTLDWVLREMTHPEGGFYSALDADSEGEEGRFYLWRRDEVLRLLDPGEDEAFCAAYGIRAEGNFQDEAGRRATGLNILHLVPRDDLSRAVFADARGRLLAARTRRERPFLDDKILTAWNGLMIGAMACAGRLFGEPRYLEAGS